MSNDDVEQRLRALAPDAPRPGLRADVLGAVRTALRSEERPGTHLARPAPWIAAAVVLAGLALRSDAMERAFRQRRAPTVAGAAERRSARDDVIAFYRSRVLIRRLVGGEASGV